MHDALSVIGVSKTYPGVYALRDVNLEVRHGEVHGVVGENGAGKSTLMGVISGSVSPETGEVLANGEALPKGDADASRAHGIAIVRQEPALLPDLTVAENLYLGMPRERRPSPRKLRAWASQQLTVWGGDFAVDPDIRVEELAPEHRFIVEIARAIASRPRVLILDEPTEHLAAEDTQRLFSHIRRLTAEDVAVIYISHRVSEVRQVANRISVLRNGRSKGTYEASELNESDIVNLIVGRELDATFPPKPQLPADLAPKLVVEGLTGERFNDVSVNVRPGEVVGLAGIDGNGQREFLRALAGLSPSKGSTTIDGRSVSYRNSTQANQAGVSYVAADRHREGVFPTLSVGRNIALRSLPAFASMGILSGRRESTGAARLSEQFNVKTPTLSARIDTLSGGNQQKAVLAGAFGSGPEVLLLDEPTQGVDVGARSEIYTLIRDHALETGMAVVVLSTDAKELVGIADRVLVFSRGKVVSELSGGDVTEEAITGEALRSTVVRESTHRDTGRVLRWFTGDSAPIVVVAAVIAILALVTQLVNPFFLSPMSLSSVLALAATLGLAALAQSLVILTGGIDMSIGPLMGLLVVIQSFYLVDGTSSQLQAMGWVLFFLTAVIVGAINWALIDLGGVHPMIATLVTFTGLQSISLLLRPTPGGVISRGIINSITTKVGPVPISFLIVITVCAFATWWLFRSRSGIALRAVGSNEATAALNALRPRLVRFCVYVGASLIASLGAIILMTQLGSGDATGGTSYTLASISAAVIGGFALTGGRGSFLGALLGAMLIQACASVTTFLGLTTAWQSFLVGGLTILAVAVYSITRSSTKVVDG